MFKGYLIRSILLLLIATYLSFPLFSQKGWGPECRGRQFGEYVNKKNNIIGFVPCKARVTNGWAIGWSL